MELFGGFVAFKASRGSWGAHVVAGGVALTLGRDLCAVFGSLWSPLGASWAYVGKGWRQLGSLWAPFGEALGRILKTSGCHLGHFLRKVAEPRKTEEFL